jgi:hypothetical protein
MTWPVAIKARNPYGVSGIPHAYLIGHDGVVVWEGHPARLSDDIVEKAVRAIPDWSSRGGSRAKRAGKDLDKGAYGKAWRAAKDVLGRDRVDDDDRTACEAMVEHVEAVADRKFEYVDALVDAGDVSRAMEVLEEVDSTFDRTEWGDRAADRLKELRRDDRASALLDAEENVAKILRRFPPTADEDDCQTVKKFLERFRERAEGDAVAYLDHLIEIYSERWTAKRT